MDWDPRVDSAKARFGRIARLSLSIFGRATAAGAYGLHRLTWHMEHGGSPPPAVVDQLARMGAGLVDRGLAPDTQQPHRATGVPRRLLPGHPTVGGFGLLPLVEHVRARWARWTLRLVTGNREPWQRVLWAYLLGAQPAFTALAPFTLTEAPPWLGIQALPGDIHRMLTALAHLPRVEDVADTPLVPGAWCWNAPVWGNPLLRGEPSGTDRRGLEVRHPALFGCRELRVLGHVVMVSEALKHFAADGAELLAGTAGWASPSLR